MDSVIEEVLNNDTYTTNEERVEAIKKGLAKLVIPKDKFNDVSQRLQKSEADYASLSTEYNDYKKSKMTEDEKKEAERQQFEAEKRANAIEKSDLAVQKLLFQNGIQINDDDVELKETLSTIVSEDYEKSIKLANSFITLINKTKDNTKKETTTELLASTPTPVGGTSSSSSISKVDMLKKEYDEAVKNKDQIRQTELMTAIYQAEQEAKNI